MLPAVNMGYLKTYLSYFAFIVGLPLSIFGQHSFQLLRLDFTVFLGVRRWCIGQYDRRDSRQFPKPAAHGTSGGVALAL